MKNEARPPMYLINSSYFIFHVLLALFLAIAAFPALTIAQTQSNAAAIATHDSTELNSTFIFAGIGAFIPTGQSYAENFSTKLVGLPVELSGGFLVPVNNETGIPLTIRYIRRAEDFVNGSSIEVLSIEPGARFYLERERYKELRLFGAVSMLLTRASVFGNYDVATVLPDGTVIVTGTAQAEQTYLDIGMGLDLGFSYPLTAGTALDAIVHIAVYFASPVSDGGLGNIGGISLSAAYRFGF